MGSRFLTTSKWPDTEDNNFAIPWVIVNMHMLVTGALDFSTHLKDQALRTTSHCHG